MIKQANKTVIGGFVVIAFTLLAASIVIFGSGRFFKESVDFLLCFEDSVQGLDEGSPVLFKGVQVGGVKSITLISDEERAITHIPVIIEIFPTKLGQLKPAAENDLRRRISKMIEGGLRATLVSKSLVTGQMAIELEIGPQPEGRLRRLGLYPEMLEIPTIPSTAERFARALEKVDLEKLQHNIESILGGFDRLVNSPEIAKTLSQLQSLFTETRNLLARIDQRLDPLADDLGSTIISYRQLALNLDQRIGPLTDDFKQTIRIYNEIGQNFEAQLVKLSTQLDITLADTRKMIDSVQASLAEDAPVMVRIEESFAQFNAAARSLRNLTDYLRQHPESLIIGRGRSGSGQVK